MVALTGVAFFPQHQSQTTGHLFWCTREKYFLTYADISFADHEAKPLFLTLAKSLPHVEVQNVQRAVDLASMPFS